MAPKAKVITKTKANAKAKAAAVLLRSEDGASYQMMARCLGQSRHKASKEICDVAKMETPYGRLVKHVTLEKTDGTPFRLAYACPFALLFVVCSHTDFFPLLTIALGVAAVGRVAFYMDETRPGNILRPDAARAMTSIFWGITDLPAWYRARQCFWFVFAHVPSKVMHDIKGGASQVYLKIMETFWAPVGHNFEGTGIYVRGRLIKLRYAFMIVDEKAEKEILGLKGASGMRMCVDCLNCVRTKKRINPRSNLVH